jgi:hypothetical protein
MKARLAYQTELKKLIKKPSLQKVFPSEEHTNPGYFKCLEGRDVITAKVSDHHPIIYDGVLFWNIMMQCKKRNGRTGISFNNGFGIIENDENYIIRLIKAADVIAEIMCLYPSIDIINKLANRLQIWQLTNNKGKSKYFALGHFPFGGDEKTTENQKLSVPGNMYCNLVSEVMNNYSNEQFILCADFNLNPYLISKWKDRAMDLIINNNSILLTTEERTNKAAIEAVTVDGILLSGGEKQRYHSARFNFSLFATLKNEDRLFQSSIKDFLIQNRHESSKVQRAYDEQYGLVLR